MSKEIFKALGKNIIIRSIGEIKDKKIIIPATGAYSQRKEWLDKECYVYSKGDDVTLVNVGDKVIIDAHKLRRIELLTETAEKLLGKKFVAEIKDKDGKALGLQEETEKFFAIKEDDIICVIS